MDIVKLTTRPRSGSGKSYTRKARMQGWIPATYYGHNIQAKNVEVEENNFLTLVRTRKTRNLVDLGLADASGDSIAIIKEIQRDIIDTKKYLHIDFQHVAMNEKITLKVPVELVGEPVGVKEQGGVLGHPAKFLNIECMPANIPEKITVNVEKLEIGDSIHVRDLTVKDAVIKDSPDEVVAVIILASEEIEAPKEEAAVEGAEGAVPGAEGAAGAAVPGAPGAPGAAPAATAAKKEGGATGAPAAGAKKDAGAAPAKPSKDAKPGK